jgi:hypothetical protein
MNTINTDRLLKETRLDPDVLSAREGIGKRTIVRWMHRGKRGVRLESYLLGARRWTTEQAFLRFVRLTSHQENHAAASARSAVASL